MKPTGEDDLWPRPQWYSIYCPVCGKPAARMVYQAPAARYLHYGRTGTYWHTVILDELQKTEAVGEKDDKKARRH